MTKLTDTREVQIKSDAPGARFVNTTEGQVAIPAGAVSQAVTMTEGELADLPPGLSVYDPEAAERGDTGGEPEIVQWPDDLASATSNDGLIKRADLIAIAEAEGVDFESDHNKARIAANIVAKRREAAAAQQ